MDERTRQRQFEDSFLNQLRNRATTLTRGALPADRVTIEAMPEGIDATRDALSRLEIYDRDLLETLPGTRTLELRFDRRALGGLFRRNVARLRVQTLADVEALLANEPTLPLGREAVLDALARYELLPRQHRPSAVVFASATGFTPEAKALVHRGGTPTLILVGGREDGGWDVEVPAGVARGPWRRLFELETQDERLRRLLYHLDQQADLLDSRGVPVATLAERLGLPAEETEALVRRACRARPHLMTVVHNNTVHVCRTPLIEEGNAMSIWSRIRRLLRLKPSVAERVRVMTAQRVRLEQVRHDVDQRLSSLEAEERDALQRGAAAASDAEKKQIAGRLMRVRRDIRRQRAQANVYTQQIDILGTHIHHLTLAEQGRRLELPKAEELTQQAAEAEQIMSELAANADLAHSIEVGAESPGMAEEEAAIFAEFDQVAAKQVDQRTRGEPEREPPAKERRESATPAPEKSRPARPELG